MRRAALGCAFVLLVVTTNAVAASEWSAPEALGTLGPPDSGFSPYRSAVAGDGKGDVVVAWAERAHGVATAFRDPSGRWVRAPLLVEKYPGDIEIAANRGGQVLLVTDGRVRAAELPRPVWSAPRPLPGKPSGRPLVAIDDAGHVTLVWTRRGGIIVAARGTVGSTRWTKPQTISPPGSEGPQLVADSSGATVSWALCIARNHCRLGHMDSPTPYPYRLEARHLAANGRWGSLQIAMRSVTLQHILGTEIQRALVPDADGGSTILWTENNWPGQDALLAVHRARGSSRWSAPALAAGLGAYMWQSPDWAVAGGNLHVATNQRGEAAVTWIATFHTGVGYELGLALRREGRSNWEQVPVPPNLQTNLPRPVRLYLADDGTLFLMGARARAVTVATRTAGDGWSLAELARSPNPYASAAGIVPGSGSEAVAVWALGHGPGVVQTSTRRVG